MPAGPHILAVDDSDVALGVIQATLEEFGLTNFSAFDDPLDALGSIEAGTISPGIILLDVMMPKMDGVELCARIRESRLSRDVPIIMLTSRRDMETLRSAFVAGANDYVTKPFEKIELEARIRSALRLKSELDRRRSSEARLAGTVPGLETLLRDGRAGASRLLAGSSEFDAALNGIDRASWQDLGIIAMSLHRAGNKSSRRRLVIPPTLPDVLGRVDAPASCILTTFGDGVFCCATLRLSDVELVAQASRFRVAVEQAQFCDQDDPFRTPLQLSTATSRPSDSSTAGAAVADAIQMAIGLPGRAKA